MADDEEHELFEELIPLVIADHAPSTWIWLGVWSQFAPKAEEGWADIPPVFQEHFKVLGYNQHMWDEGHPKAAVESMAWTQLSKEQQAAAQALGYTEKMWDTGEGPTLHAELEAQMVVRDVNAAADFTSPPESDFYSPPESQACGIGVDFEVDPNSRGFYVDRMVDGGPASSSGVQRGDLVTVMDGLDMRDFTKSTLPSLVLGPEGSTLQLKILRAGETLPHYIEVTRFQGQRQKQEMLAKLESKLQAQKKSKEEALARAAAKKQAEDEAAAAALLKEETTPCTKEEGEWCRKALASVPANHREQYAACPLDVLQLVRGHAKEKDRAKATLQAIAGISAWRLEVGYYEFFDRMHPSARKYYNWWPEYIYGFDKFGHMLHGVRVAEDTAMRSDDGFDKFGHIFHGVRVAEMNAEQLVALPDVDVEKIHGQKLKAYSVYKQDASIKAGQQRYKQILIVDLTNMQLANFHGKKGKALAKIFAMGSTYYPESMWRIYLVNTPMIFRAVWSMVRAWLHPITVNKIQIVGSASEAIKLMNMHHIPTSAIPKWLGGECEGKSTYDYIQEELVAKKRPHGS